MTKRNDQAVIGIVILVVGIIVALVALGYYAINSAWVETYTVHGTVEKKWIDYSTEGSHYLLRLDGNRMVEVQRNVIYSGQEYNPDIVFSDINVNSTYDFTCWGWQFSWADVYWYPNVIKAEEV